MLLIELIAGVSLPLSAQTPATLLWTYPDSIPFSTPLSQAQLNARAYAGPPVAVPLGSSYNVSGITSDGVSYNTGGLDGSSYAFSSELLGPSLTWQQISFALGAANRPDAVSSATIPLPSGSFGSLLLLGTLVNNETPPTAQFVVHYTDGTSTTVTQSMSDWVNPRSYPGESVVTCTPTRHNFDGSIDFNSVCVYGYSLALDPTRIPLSLTLPSDRDVVLLSAVLLAPAVPGNFSYTPASGVLLAAGPHTLSTSFTPANGGAYAAASAMVPLEVTPANPLLVPAIVWAAPTPITPGTALSSEQLDAAATSALNPVPISLAAYFRVDAMYADGTVYYERGFDGSSIAFSKAQLGSALHFAGGSFPLGPAAVPDAVTSTTIALPAGNFNTLYVLGAGANGAQRAQPFTVTYSDGSSVTTPLDLSSWTAPQGFDDETIVASSTLGNLSTGLQAAGIFDVYGYRLPLDSTRTVSSLQLPENSNVILLAAGLGTAGSFPVPGSFVYTPPAGTVPVTALTLTTLFTPADAGDFTTATASVPLVFNLRDFSLTAIGGSTLSATYGQSPSLQFAVAPLSVQYNGPVTFTVAGELPPLATVSFSPASIAAGGGPATVTLTLHTRLLSGSLLPSFEQRWGVTSLALLLLVPFAATGRRRKAALGLMVLTGLALIPTGCGSGYHDSAFPVTLVATDGTFRHTLPIVLHMEASAQ